MKKVFSLLLLCTALNLFSMNKEVEWLIANEKSIINLKDITKEALDDLERFVHERIAAIENKENWIQQDRIDYFRFCAARKTISDIRQSEKRTYLNLIKTAATQGEPTRLKTLLKVFPLDSDEANKVLNMVDTEMAKIGIGRNIMLCGGPQYDCKYNDLGRCREILELFRPYFLVWSGP